MADYKYYNEHPENGVIKIDTGERIQYGDEGWDDYQSYVDAGGITDPWATDEELRVIAMNDTIDKIVDYTGLKTQGSFYYAPMDANFNIDHDLSIKAKVRGKNSDSTWKTADKEVDGVKYKKISFKKQELSDFADAVIDKVEEIMEVKNFHIEAVQDMYLHNGYNIDDIYNYDYTTGWPV